jgi:hypothetical protein
MLKYTKRYISGSEEHLTETEVEQSEPENLMRGRNRVATMLDVKSEHLQTESLFGEARLLNDHELLSRGLEEQILFVLKICCIV